MLYVLYLWFDPLIPWSTKLEASTLIFTPPMQFSWYIDRGHCFVVSCVVDSLFYIFYFQCIVYFRSKTPKKHRRSRTRTPSREKRKRSRSRSFSPEHGAWKPKSPPREKKKRERSNSFSPEHGVWRSNKHKHDREKSRYAKFWLCYKIYVYCYLILSS